MSAESRTGGGLIFGLILPPSSTFIGIRINSTMQVTDVNDIRRTIIQTSENRKAGGSTPLQATTSDAMRERGLRSLSILGFGVACGSDSEIVRNSSCWVRCPGADQRGQEHHRARRDHLFHQATLQR